MAKGERGLMHNPTSANGARLGDYFVLLRRQWLVVLLCLALGIGAAMAYLQWAPKEYRSTTAVLVTAIGGGSDRANAINLDTEAQLVTATETVTAAADELGIPEGDARGLADQVGVTVPPNTEILDIRFVGDSAAQAQRGSLAFAEAYLAQRRATAEAVLETEEAALQERIDAVQAELDDVEAAAADLPADSSARDRADDQIAGLNNQLATLGSQQNLIRSQTVSPGRIVTQPRLPAAPSSPDPLITLAAGVLLGALLGVGVAALRHRADDVVRTPEDLYRRTGVPVAAVLANRLHAGEVDILPPLSADGRGYARLRNLVTTSLEESDRRVVLAAGVRRGGGPIAANLAASLARAGEDVFLVCADVFGPTAEALLQGPPSPGLAEVLAGELDVDAAARRIPDIPHLRVLGPGLDPDRADALLQTRSPRKLVDQLLELGTYVVLEAPPTTDSPDAQTLANVAEIAVLVVEAGQTSSREVIDAVAQLESMHAAVLGAVIARYGRDSDLDGRLKRTAAEDDEASHDPGDEATPTDEATQADEVSPTDEATQADEVSPTDEVTQAGDGPHADEETEPDRGAPPKATPSGATAANGAPSSGAPANGASAKTSGTNGNATNGNGASAKSSGTNGSATNGSATNGSATKGAATDAPADDSGAVVPTGGRPQLVPPGSAGPAAR